ncbi:Plant lipid transfer protein/Par allergen [Corchorus capsularis]|uniref:Non-specific lipid-transfer protein n=1 Tax=Corchorus capsularis TaxID=210143 RepID=A0A1R3JCL7_COCAP|nr:Plant lipid transfer protein/Par allergen [Corchorus capsularis]
MEEEIGTQLTDRGEEEEAEEGKLLENGYGPLAPCCNGIKALNAAAATTQDRQQACTCIKNIATTITGINYGLANGLPGKCGVNIPYKLSPSTDCKRQLLVLEMYAMGHPDIYITLHKTKNP